MNVMVGVLCFARGHTGRVEASASSSAAVPSVRRAGRGGGGITIEARLARLEAASKEQTRLLAAILDRLPQQAPSSPRSGGRRC